MSILDLVIAFKKVWKEINKDKTRSQIQINEIKALMNQWKERTDDIKKVEDILSKHWKYFPINQRKDYIQKTLDLIHYGFDVEYHEDSTRTYNSGYGYGLVQIYNDTYEYIARRYNDMKHHYNKRHYEYVNRIYEDCIDRINEKLEQYHILENNNNE